MEAGPDVRFDFEGALTLARRLWALGDQVETMMAHRRRLAAGALATWLGVYGRQFGDRVDTESADILRIAGELRAAASGWAACWQQAMDQQNRVLHAREVKRVESARGGWDSFWGGVFGHDDLPNRPAPVALPAPPRFSATATLTRY